MDNILIRLTSDSILKNLMLIPPEHFDDLALMRRFYFIDAVISDSILPADINSCVLINEETSLKTDNANVFINRLSLSCFVKNAEFYSGLEKRTFLIVNRIYELLNNSKLHGYTLKFESLGDMQCNMLGFKASFINFNYKKIFV